MENVTAITVSGHTDSSGSDGANQKLSETRANAVRNALIEDGIDGSLVSATGYGESRPIADNTTAAGRATNRRVEIQFDTLLIASRKKKRAAWPVSFCPDSSSRPAHPRA